MSTSSRKRPGEESLRGSEAKKHRVASSLPERRMEEAVQSPPDPAPADHYAVEIKLRSTSKAIRNDPKSREDWLEELRARWPDFDHLDAQKNEGKAEEVIADDQAQPEEAKDRVEINTTTLPEPQHPENLDSVQTEHGPADGVSLEQDESMDQDKLTNHEELLSEDESPEYRSDDDESFEDSAARSSNDEFAEFEWLEPLDGIVTYTGGTADVAKHKQIGYCVGKLIRRNKIQDVFYNEMEQPSRDTSLLAFELFDRYGRLKPEYKNHPIRKGSGIWKEEIDTGDILLIEEVRINEEYRRRGLGGRVVTSMLNKTKEKSRNFFAIAWPSALWNNELRQEVEGKTETERRTILEPYDDITKAFWRSLGFRRIGSSCWFALASDSGHLCHSLSVSDDCNPLVPHHDVSEYPQALMAAMIESDDAKCIEKLEQFLQQTPAADPSWFMPDKEGNTLLHIAGLNSQPKTVDWIMGNDFGKQMLVTRNDAGDTPLEATIMDLEKMRTHREWMALTVPMSDKFEGHSSSAVSCLARLKELTEASQLDLARLTFGCTCGQCIEGFLSPRMTHALLCQAEVQHDMLKDEVARESGPNWIEFNNYMFKHIPKNVQENFKTNKSMRQGFTNMFDHVATCLRAKVPPTEVNVWDVLRHANEWPPVTRNFLQRGGTVASVATMCFELAMNQDEFAGDGEHQAVFSHEIDVLPACRNDHEFGFVSGMCGYKRISQSC